MLNLKPLLLIVLCCLLASCASHSGYSQSAFELGWQAEQQGDNVNAFCKYTFANMLGDVRAADALEALGQRITKDKLQSGMACVRATGYAVRRNYHVPEHYDKTSRHLDPNWRERYQQESEKAKGLAPDVIVQTSKDGRHTNISKPGSLANTHVIACVDIDQLTSQYTPVDLYQGAMRCIQEENYKYAAALHALAGTYGYFDRLRVTDRSAHQATGALMIKNYGVLTQEQKEIFAKVRNDQYTIEELCSKIIKLGAPNYYPTYMINHGLNAIMGKDDAVKTDFNTIEGWKQSLDNYLHCDEHKI